MGYKIMIKAFGFWLPANHYYYNSEKAAQLQADHIIRNSLGGNSHLCKVVKAGAKDEAI